MKEDQLPTELQEMIKRKNSLWRQSLYLWTLQGGSMEAQQDRIEESDQRADESEDARKKIADYCQQKGINYETQVVPLFEQ